MSDVAIRVENISKRYTIGKTSSGSLRETIAGLFSKNEADRTEEFYALRDVSFEVKRGEAIGIIGKNGAGKSTLLKILSRITEPTSGRIEIDGRVSSLLEVGTGFHPELTGRENVFLNGTILGMSRTEVKRKFDEIVDFSGVEKFLDTPVKRYSSGMTVRLAFAVAAHLEPEILIIDEVLAVGDAEFQKKCLGKMEDVAGEGRTVIFVSHNMGAVEKLCSRSIWLKNGLVYVTDTTSNIVRSYLYEGEVLAKALKLSDRTDRQGNQVVMFLDWKLMDNEGNNVLKYRSGQDAIIRLQLLQTTSRVVKNVHIALGINDAYGTRITQLNSETINSPIAEAKPGIFYVDFIIQHLPLSPNSYSFNLFATVNSEVSDWFVDGVIPFEVEAGDYFNTGRLLPSSQGSFYIKHRMKVFGAQLVKQETQV
jgi:lipopolysaccharide transport system ATP-binding protein